jgi:pimeloyl-ACP methyl ester carboxylesterase
MLIFVHGMCNIPEAWNPLIEYFNGKGYRCKAVDLQKGCDLRKTKISNYVNIVADLVSSEDILVGHSLGGLIVLKVAEQKEVKATVAICPAPSHGISTPMVTRILPLSLKYLPNVILNRPFKPDFPFIKKLLLVGLTENEFQTAVKEYKKLRKDSSIVIREIILQRMKINEKNITCPLLFIAAKYDKAIAPSVVKQMADKFNGEFQIYTCCHHFFFNSNWTDIAAGISSFISNIKDESSSRI